MNKPDLDPIRACLEGGLPKQIASCSSAGVADICEVPQLYFVDAQHVALPYACSTPLRNNLLSNPRAAATISDPVTAARYRLAFEYLSTESSGGLFSSLQARHAGTAGALPLLGVDICRVLSIEQLDGQVLPAPAAPCNRLAAVRLLSQRLAAADELSQAFDLVLDGLDSEMGMDHALILCVDESGLWLYTVASRGYAQSGVGSEVEVGSGLIGAVAQFRAPVRLSSLSGDYREPGLHLGPAAYGGDIPFPVLHRPHSQMAVPIAAGNWLAGVLYVESADQRRFDYQDEDALVALGQQLGLAMRWLTRQQELLPEAPEVIEDIPAAPPAQPAGKPVVIRYFATTQSVFIDDDYLIKGVAGAVLWILLCDYVRDGRSESSNRALRLDPRLRLPDFGDNLYTRLLLLQRRLDERCDWLVLDKLGRGRFRLRVDRPVQLVDGEAT